MTTFTARRNFLKKSAAASLAWGSATAFMSFPKRAYATGTSYSVPVTQQIITGYDQDKNGNKIPHYYQARSGNNFRLANHTKANQLANDLENARNARTAKYATIGVSLPTVDIRVIEHTGPNSDPTSNAGLQDVFVLPTFSVVPILDANGIPISQVPTTNAFAVVQEQTIFPQDYAAIYTAAALAAIGCAAGACVPSLLIAGSGLLLYMDITWLAPGVANYVRNSAPGDNSSGELTFGSGDPGTGPDLGFESNYPYIDTTPVPLLLPDQIPINIMTGPPVWQPGVYSGFGGFTISGGAGGGNSGICIINYK